MHVVASALLVSLLVAACSGSSDDSGSGPDPTNAPSGSTAPGNANEIDRSQRFASLDTYCKPATEEPEEAPEATDEGITADEISITHIRVQLEQLQDLGFAIPLGDTADQAETFVKIINERCGGIHGRKLKLSLVEAPPTAPEGQDPAAIAQSACIKATEDNKAVFAWSGTGWGGQGGASCVTGDHDTVYLTTYTISPEDLESSENRLYSTTLSPADGLAAAAKVLDEDGAFDGKKVGVVMADAPGEPEIVEQGLLNTLEDLGADVVRTDVIGCNGGNICNGNINASVSGMKADGVDVIFPLLNVISLPGYLQEMVTQGFKPGDVQFYQTGYNAQAGDLVSSKVVEFGGKEAGALYNGTIIIAPDRTGAFRMPGFKPSEFGEMCNAEYQKEGGDKYEADDPETNSAYGATAGACSFVRIIARAIDMAGPNPTRQDLAEAVENLGVIDGDDTIPPNFAPGKYTAPNELNRLKWNYPCPPDKKPFDGMCILPEGESFPIPS
ncbi:MAG TPA: ABC transporter substrate-binding protein [Acidimicrobiia bacterium]|nr:ABC transporter substrate-binding protein [Acidimicrobiia bacterium]